MQRKVERGLFTYLLMTIREMMCIHSMYRFSFRLASSFIANSTSFSSLRLYSLLWTGHSTVIDEIVDFFEQTTVQQQPNNRKIGAVLASVGGGGLLCGILEGLERNYHSSNKIRSDMVRGSKVFACETEGAASFAASFNSPDGSIVCLDGINSIATSLGATSVTPAVIQRSQRHRDRGEINSSGEDVFSYVCTDSEAVQGCVQFSSAHRMLVGKSFKVLIVLSHSLLKNSQYDSLHRTSLWCIAGSFVFS